MGLKITVMGGKQAGCIGLLSILATNCEVISVVAYDDNVEMAAKVLGIKVFKSIKEEGFFDAVKKSDLLFSVHGREIIPKEILYVPPLGCINVHPCLYKYKGPNPVQRLLDDKNTKASVGVHYMSEDVDSGKVILEEFVDVQGKSTVEEVYNVLYPYYIMSIIKAIKIIKSELNLENVK